jgi:hypothetical protein
MKLKLALSFYSTNTNFTDSNGSTAADEKQTATRVQETLCVSVHLSNNFIVVSAPVD